MNKYRLSALAFQDLEEIADYLGERNPAAAVKLLDRLFESFRREVPVAWHEGWN